MKKPVNGVWIGYKRYDVIMEIFRVSEELMKDQNNIKAWRKCSRGYAPIATNPKSHLYGKVVKKQPK